MTHFYGVWDRCWRFGLKKVTHFFIEFLIHFSHKIDAGIILQT